MRSSRWHFPARDIELAIFTDLQSHHPERGIGRISIWHFQNEHELPANFDAGAGAGPLLVSRFNYYMARSAKVGTANIYYPADPELPTRNHFDCDSATHRGKGWVMLLCGRGG